jgi:hypothetical protein
MTDAPPRRPGDRVRIRTPENLALHGSLAVVASVEPYGYALVAPAAATGRFRALPSEVESVGPELLTASPTGEVDDAPAGKVLALCEGNEGRVESAVDTPEDVVYLEPQHRPPPAATGEGIGQPCNNCGGMNLRRNGSCLVCTDCGDSTGCG